MNDALNIALGLPSGTPTPGVRKVAAVIPVTREMLIDMGEMGPLGKADAEAARWRRLWHERPAPALPSLGDPLADLMRSWARSMLRTPPPWESADPPALPVFRIWGRNRK